MESFASFLAECQNKKNSLACERYFQTASEINFIGSYFYDNYSTNIPRASCATFHQQHRVDMYLFEILFLKNLLRKNERVLLFP